MLIDTHVLYWWLTQPELLSRKAKDIMNQAQLGKTTVYICDVSLWELEYKRNSGKLSLPFTLREVFQALSNRKGFAWLTPSREEWLLAAEFSWNHKDQADRMLAATAKNHDLVFLTKDQKFHLKSCPIQATW